IVTGHVDTVAELLGKRAEGDSIRLVFSVPPPFEQAIAAKGSVAVDGVSLTVNETGPAPQREGGRFGVNIIPHTQAATTLGALAVGDHVNLEIDLLARYVARLLGKDIA